MPAASETWSPPGASLSCSPDIQSTQQDGLYLLLDGRIDNLQELAHRLRLEAADACTILLQAYRRWGAAFLRDVIGDFALALFDGHGHQLLLARDPSGVRPLHFTETSGEIRFSSDARALLAWPGARMVPDEAHIAQWLLTLPCRGNSTFFQGIRTVPPGSFLSAARGRTEVVRYWTPEDTPLLHLRDPREYADGLRDVLSSAIRNRIPAHGQLATMLSGGLDSSSVTALTAGMLAQENLELLSLTSVPAHQVEQRYPGRFCDEGPYAAAVAAMYPNIRHRFVRTSIDGLFPLLDLVCDAEERPVMNPSNAQWMLEICRQAANSGAEVLFDSLMGNNTISYNGSYALAETLLHGRLRSAWRIMQDDRRLGQRWRRILHMAIRPLLSEAMRATLDRSRSSEPHTIFDYILVRPEFLREHGLDAARAVEFGESSDSRTVRIARLRRFDVGMMAASFRSLTGIITTDPTADRRVAEYCLSVPVEYFVQDGVPRSLIREAMKGLLPEQLRMELRRGTQASDVLVHLAAEGAAIRAEVERMSEMDVLRRALNLPELLGLATKLSEGNLEGEKWMQFRTRVERALSLGRFLRRMQEGTLFSTSNDGPPARAVAISD